MTQISDICRSLEVIAIDIDPAKVALAKANATVYGVADRIDFIVADFFAISGALKVHAMMPTSHE